MGSGEDGVAGVAEAAVAAARRRPRPRAGRCRRRTAASSPPAAAAGNRVPRGLRRRPRDTGVEIILFKTIKLTQK